MAKSGSPEEGHLIFFNESIACTEFFQLAKRQIQEDSGFLSKYDRPKDIQIFHKCSSVTKYSELTDILQRLLSDFSKLVLARSSRQ